jgi:kynurenine formamidase
VTTVSPDASATSPALLNGRAVSRNEFDALFDELREWDTWSEAGRGAFNRVTGRHTAAAAGLVRAGKSVALARPWNTVAGVDNDRPALHYMSDLGDVEVPEPSAFKDFIGVDFHGKSTSHIDALSHIAYRGQLFGGREAAEVVTAAGAEHGSVDQLGVLVTRGVLLDLPAVREVEWLEPGTAVTADDLAQAEEHLGVRVGEGDALLIRSGAVGRRDALGAWNPAEASAGLHVDAMRLLAERGLSCLGGDGDSDVRPSPVEGLHSPIHVLALTAMGLPLLDNLDLEPLSRECAAARQYEFLFVVAPLSIPGGTGSPVNPVAVL